MRVVMAEAFGMCFGVRDALEVMRGIERPTEVTVRGQLVHNASVVREVVDRGFSVLTEGESGGAAVKGRVLITAHGVSDQERSRLLGQAKELIDATCPLVKRAHAMALALAREGFFVIVVGKRGHVEVQGLTGDLCAGAFRVVESALEVPEVGWEKIGVIAQTTAVEREVFAVVERVRELNGGAEVRLVNTVCGPTRERQAAVERLLERVDVLVVVGGRNSNNTIQLVRRGEERGVRVVRVEGEGELREEWFGMREVVGLTAGTSVLDETVEGVRRKLFSFYAGGVGESESVELVRGK